MRRLLRSIDLNRDFNFFGRRLGPGLHVRRLKDDNDVDYMVRRLPRDRHFHVYLEDKLFDYVTDPNQVASEEGGNDEKSNEGKAGTEPNQVASEESGNDERNNEGKAGTQANQVASEDGVKLL